MKYRLEGTIIEDIDTYVRISLGNGKTEVTKKQNPTPEDVADLLNRMQGHWPNTAQLRACSMAAQNAKNNKIELDI